MIVTGSTGVCSARARFGRVEAGGDTADEGTGEKHRRK